MLLQIFAASPMPEGPQWTILAPIFSSCGRTSSKSLASPPTIKVMVAASAPATPPETGASSMRKPRSRAALATS